MKKRMTRAKARAFKRRRGADKIEQLRRTSPADKFRQLAALMASAKNSEQTEAELAEEAEVRERWNRLRRIYGRCKQNR